MSMLKEDNGNNSTTRVIVISIVIVALITGIGLALTGNLDVNGVSLVLGELGLALGAKTVSKKLEKWKWIKR